jgi:hypothetical protein
LKYKVILLLLLTTSFQGCGIYSFSGASIPPNAKTMTIVQFDNTAPIVVPALAQTLSDRIRAKFIAETGLRLVENEGDLVFEGIIQEYNVSPAAVSGAEQTTLNRLTIGVKVIYSNKIDPTLDFETVFRRYADFSATTDLASVENQLIQEISTQLIDDIFNKAFVNW